MKEKLIDLIDEISKIELLFHRTPDIPGVGVPSLETIYDITEFQIWKQLVLFELQNINDKKNDSYISDTIKILTEGFNGWRDKKDFNNVKGKLLAIENNIDKYYTTIEPIKNIKQPKIFISHSNKDKEYIKKLVTLLNSMGLNENNIFCSSVPGYDIPIGDDIFTYLREMFVQYDLYVIFVHSHNYYASPVSLNEMGAAWALKNDYASLLLPGFNFNEMTGVVNKHRISIKLDVEMAEVQDKLNQLYNTLKVKFSLPERKYIIWEQNRDQFLQDIVRLGGVTEKTNKEIMKIDLSENAKKLLSNVMRFNDDTIKIMNTLGGKIICSGNNLYKANGLGNIEFAKWEAAFQELLKHQFIEVVGRRGEIFKITNSGYEYIKRENNI